MNIPRHRTRPIRFIRRWEHRGWRTKLYGICETEQFPDEACLEAAIEIAAQTLPHPAASPDRYGLAFVTVPQARPFNQIIVDWWERNNELRHRVFKALPEAPYAFKEITETGEAFCVWELRVLAFERAAWLDFILNPPEGADIDGYLARVLNEDC